MNIISRHKVYVVHLSISHKKLHQLKFHEFAHAHLRLNRIAKARIPAIVLLNERIHLAR